MGAGSNAGPHFCLGASFPFSSVVRWLRKRSLPTSSGLFTLRWPDRSGSMEEAILAIALGLIAIAASPPEAKESLANGVSIAPDIAAQPPAAAENEKSKQVPSRATANLVSLFSTDDYPREAIRNGEQGIVGVRLTVGADGKVADCAVIQSSGSPSLDVQTCRILWSRAQFTPARDAQGKPIQDTYSQRIRWELPEGNPAEFEEAYSRLILTVDPGRAVVDCRREGSVARENADPHCSENIEALRQLISTAPDWIPFEGREVVFETQQRVGEPQSGPELGERPGEFQLLVARLQLTIDAAGKVKSCSRESWGPMRSRSANFTCEFAQRWLFDELPKQESNRNDRQLTLVNATYLRKPQAKLPSN